jgi:hypothetical protein
MLEVHSNYLFGLKIIQLIQIINDEFFFIKNKRTSHYEKAITEISKKY